MSAAYDTPRMAAIRRILETPHEKLCLNRHGELFTAREEYSLSCPTIDHELLVEYLRECDESEWENWVLDCFIKNRGRIYAS